MYKLSKKFDSFNIIYPLQHADTFSARDVLKAGCNIKDQSVSLC